MRKFLILCLVFISFNAEAKRDFAVFSELRCEANICYDKESGLPFSGELRKFYHNGVVSTSLSYKNGVRDGASHYYYISGNERKQEIYNNGVINGRLTEYYDGGNMKFEAQLDNGKLSGIYRKYYEDGQIKIDEEYLNGKKQGRARKFNGNGKLLREAFYDNGKLIDGACYYDNGKKREAFTQNMIDAYNNKGIVPCDIDRLVTF